MNWHISTVHRLWYWRWKPMVKTGQRLTKTREVQKAIFITWGFWLFAFHEEI